MDFSLAVKDCCAKLAQPNNYFDHLWDCICKYREVDTTAYLKEKSIFLHHLPVNVQAFLLDLIHKVEEIRSNNATIDWSTLDQKYLCVLIFWAINQIETATPLISISASRLYCLISCLPHEQERNIFFESIYSAILTSIDYYIPIDDASLHLHVLLENMKLLLNSITLSRDLTRQTASVLYKIICMDRQIMFDRFQIGKYLPSPRSCLVFNIYLISDESTINLQHAAFICLKIMLQKYDCTKADEKDDIMYILFLITGCLKSSNLQNKSRDTLGALFSNITAFLKDMCSNFTQNDKLVALVIKTLAVNPQYDIHQVSRYVIFT